MCQCMKLNSATTHLKIIWSRQPKIHPPHLCCPASELLFTGKKKNLTIRYSSSTKDKAALLFKQSFFLPSHTHNPLSRILWHAASMCTWEVYFSPPPLFPYSSPPPSAGFALMFPAFVHVHCFTPPCLFNVLLRQVLTTVFYCLLNILLFSTVKVPGITGFQQAAF